MPAPKNPRAAEAHARNAARAASRVYNILDGDGAPRLDADGRPMLVSIVAKAADGETVTVRELGAGEGSDFDVARDALVRARPEAEDGA